MTIPQKFHIFMFYNIVINPTESGLAIKILVAFPVLIVKLLLHLYNYHLS